ncbi:hypothetical protein B0A55_09513 [Friedmanniomyces simplex]|uniref:Uncharacterized protein n=1 Tax=Friedmanniomyces simplex TaxID=329884 RepID=A0A4U0X5K8_9PEZI|nr:hypothetical protein B0A55_09513 [Friedmanniomyces simplex]
MQLYIGPNLRYFFQDGKGNSRYRATPEFLKVFTNKQITTIHNVAFGTGESFYIGYTAVDGRASAWFEPEDDYPKLFSWLQKEHMQHDFSQVSVSLGLDGAFFASSNQGHRWRNIPKDACNYYQTFTQPDLFHSKRYPQMSSLDLVKEISKAQYAILNPFAPDQHFIVFADGSAHYSLPQQWAGDIASLFQQYASQTVQAQKPRLPGRFGRHGSASSTSNVSSSYTAPTVVQSQQQLQQQPSTLNQAFRFGNNILDPYNNVTNAGDQSDGGGFVGSAGDFSVNQAMVTMQSSVNTMNTVANVGGQGMDLVNQIAGNGLLVGQVAGQFVGAAAGCTVMWMH